MDQLYPIEIHSRQAVAIAQYYNTIRVVVMPQNRVE